MGDKFKVSELTSEALRQLAANVDKFGGDNNGSINKSEFKQLQRLLNGEEFSPLKSDLSGETDDIKKVFGYTGSVKAGQTSAAVMEAFAQEAFAQNYDSSNPIKSVKDAYYRYRGIAPETRAALTDEAGNPVKGMSPMEAYEAVEKDCKGNKEFKKAVKDLRKYSIDTEAKMVVLDAVSRTTATDSKDVKKQAEAILKAEGNWDKHTKKALNGKGHNWWSNTFNWLSLRNSDMKEIRKAQAYGNRAAEKATKTYTKKDFTDAIGKRSPLFEEDEHGFMAIEKLTNVRGEQLVTRKDGQFDITKLSEFISAQIGSDNTLSRQQNKADAEIEVIRAEFRKQGIELTKRDTKQLVKFCGYRIEHKNLTKAVYDGTLGAVAAAAGTGVALATQVDQLFRGGADVKQHVDLSFTFTNKEALESYYNQIMSNEEMKKLIADNKAIVNKGVGGVQVLVDQSVFKDFTVVADKFIPLNMLKSAGIGAATGVLASLLSYGPSEQDIFSTRFDCRSYEDFLAYVDSRKELNDAQKMALKQLAIAFIAEDSDGKALQLKTQAPKRDENGALVLDKEGNPVMEEITQLAWDCEGFKNYLNQKAGFTSNLNKTELFKAIKEVPTPVIVKEEEPVEEPKEEPQEEEPCEDCQTRKEETAPFEISVREEKFRSWQDLVNGYDCLQVPAYNRSVKVGKRSVPLANRMVKVIQAIDVSNIKSEAELRQAYNVKSIAAFAEDTIKYGVDKAIERHPELPINKEELEGVLSATAGLKGNAYVPELYDAENDDTCSWTKKANAKLEQGGKTTATLTQKGSTIDGKTTYWRKCPGSDKWEQIDKATYDALQK